MGKKGEERNIDQEGKVEVNNKMAELNLDISIITFNISELNVPIKNKVCQAGFKK